LKLPPVATTTVGSFPRPAWLADHNRSEVTFRVEGALLREALDDATIVALHEQERLGLDLLTDGEQRRTNFIFYVLGKLEGFDVVQRKPKNVFRARVDYNRLVPRVVGPVRRRVPTIVDDFRFAQAHTSKPVKVSVPGPMTVVDSTCDDFYRDEAALAMDVAAAMNEELLELQASGCQLVQIDEPAMTRYHEKVAAYGLRALGRCLEGIKVPSIIHLCYGYPGGQGLQHEFEYPDLLAQLMETPIGGFSLEFARSGYSAKILDVVRGRLLMYGCVDPGDTPPEPLEVLMERVESALKYVKPEHLLLAPDCGLMTISRGLAWAKIQRLAETAREIRKSL
jgi:5-methyltetrahydropteroyltriglutamate--homocysteine methyltransferase